MTESLLMEDSIIYQEMMAHLPLFAHAKPRQIAILHDQNNLIEQEVRKHPNIESVAHDLTNIAANSLDVLIIADTPQTENYQTCFQLLHTDGILLQQSEAPFSLVALKNTHKMLSAAGFDDIHTLQFPQASGWRTAVLAVKYGILRRPREKDIFNKTFRTRFYNLDVHKAAFALPEFMRAELVTD